MLTNNTKKITIFLLSFFMNGSLIMGCQFNNTNPLTMVNFNKNSKLNTRVSGRVYFTSLNKYTTKATFDDISKNATISLIYPYDHPTKPNQTVAAGLTDNKGSFSLTPPDAFIPSTDDIFVLEALKRIGTVGKTVMSLRTYIQWNGTGWDSITYPKTILNLYTTALSIIAGYSANLSTSGLIKTIDISSDTSVLTKNISDSESNVIITSKKLNEVAEMVNKLILAEKDPVEGIVCQNSTNCIIKGALSKIVFTSDRDGNNEIYVINADGSDPQKSQLTSNNADNQNPAWSPDGTRIAFTSDRDGNKEIYVMNADGSDPQIPRLTNNKAVDQSPAWSPDGTRIAFSSDREGKINQIFVMDASDGSSITRITDSNADEKSPAWSPDGTRIAFTSNRDVNNQIYVMNADGNNPVRLKGNNNEEENPAWSPDGTRIAFTSNRDGNKEIYVMNADGNNQARMTNNIKSDDEPTWSPDGSRIFFNSDRSGTYQLYSMNVSDSNNDGNGDDLTQLTNNSKNDLSPNIK